MIFFIMQNAFYYLCKFSPPFSKNIIYKRFTTFDEANTYIKKKTGLTEYKEVNNLKLKFAEGVEIFYSAPQKEIAEGLENAKRLCSGILSSEVFYFLRHKKFKIPGAPRSLIIDLLKQTDIMDQEIRIMDYKLKHLDKFPEMRILLHDKKAIKTH